MMEDLKRELSATSFGEGLNARHIETLAERAVMHSYEPGEFIFREGEDARFFYIILEGRVSLEVSAAERGEIVFQTISAGDALGLSWLFPPFHWHFDARSLEGVRALVVESARLREKIEEDHDFGYEILKRVARIIIGRLQATRLQMTDMYGAGA